MNRGRKMLCFVLVLALCTGIYVVTRNLQKTETVTESSGTFDLTARKTDDAVGISWVSGSETLSFVRSGDAWKLEGEESYPIRSADVQELAESLVDLQATRKLEDVKDQSAYGLNGENFTVKITWSDGTFTTWAEGDETPFGDGVYLTVSDQPSYVFTAENSLSALFGKSRTDLTAEENIPAVGTAAAVRIGDTVSIHREETATTVNPDLLWQEDGTGRLLDTSAAETLADNIIGVTFDTLVKAGATTEDFTEKGVDEEHATVLSVTDTEGNGLVFLVGGTDEQGSRYVRLKDSDQIHTVAAATVEAITGTTAESLYSKDLITLPYEQIMEATLTAGEISYTIRKTGSAEGEEGENDAEGAGVDEEALWSAMLAITGEAFSDGTGAGDKLLTVRVTSDTGMSGEVTVCEYDAESYLAEMNGVTVTVSAEKTDKLIRMLKQTQK